ncbi:DUF924 family protein [Hyphobacterium sp. HN65]|uniref:DUF924 family protein n=1 Tax=Hyphobacterium lacteum TaxID=3116575 RepID=A0ABU7LQ39_9PROT|nr:DUF924 family protein [Hyphobacterium sp. HN65]MEE2526027.1 DUF924 family protein [Hyphobacterium sp. HN65]
MTQPTDILQFWFEETEPKLHFVSTPEFDAKIRRKFARTIEEEARRFDNGIHPWMETPEGGLALLILFDQFTRNVWRGSGKAFDFDSLARQIARTMIDSGQDRALPVAQRSFVYMPFMHSEDLADQDMSIELFTTRMPAGNTNLHHARLHRDVIVKFGRFPYRNEALGRASTPEERAYLDGGGYAPGSKRPAEKT